ncbi:Hypothetical_protein [Hexamita inflata]|uniref:Hypothetical_protein n=1 Tax=Hexamita inflata TaxID=28002 RepID=A0AA86RAU7_9EUKA|nr:Hypothetical protein HINF_LOCUS60402 [Hexamita inflata]
MNQNQEETQNPGPWRNEELQFEGFAKSLSLFGSGDYQLHQLSKQSEYAFISLSTSVGHETRLNRTIAQMRLNAFRCGETLPARFPFCFKLARVDYLNSQVACCCKRCTTPDQRPDKPEQQKDNLDLNEI